MKLVHLFTDTEATKALRDAQDGWVRQQVLEMAAKEERALMSLIQAAHAAGRVPRFVWRHPHGEDLHSGDSMPTDGPWVVYTLTPEAVAMALGAP